jgi:hypothetical protein
MLPPSSGSTEFKKVYSSWVACTLKIQAPQNIANYLPPYLGHFRSFVYDFIVITKY